MNPSRIINPKLAKSFLFLYFLGLTLYCFVKPPFRDTFYYWDWGRHLALSYFDGPPMIAYMLRLSTTIFGNNLFALNFVGLICIACTGFFIYKTAELLLDKETGFIAALLWILFPITSAKLLVCVTYDTCLSLFWAMTVYCVCRYLKYQKDADLYWTGMAIGLMLLAKYSGIVLVFGILIFLVLSPIYRGVFKNKHFYFSILLALIIFSPVIIWNLQNDWVSVKYLSSVHKLADPHPGHYIGNVLGNFFVFALVPFIAMYKYKLKSRPSLINFMLCISLVFFIFWQIAAFSDLVFMTYLAPASISLSLFSAYYIKHYHYQKTLYVILAIFFMCSLWRIFVDYDQYDPLSYSLSQKAINTYANNPKQAILANDFWGIEMLTFWAQGQISQPLPCSGQENQYQYWNQSFRQSLIHKQVKQAIYIAFATPGTSDPTTPPACIAEYFASCRALATLNGQRTVPFTHKVLKKQAYLYQCQNA
ncbi:MAG: dolichol monophosphate mannose synthase [Gammaproteobacteria bacterium]|jgi:hypothetical protein|nr:dolichol monophosphate mannose synthase [Gammaproteobacteria bacterium]